MVKKDKQLLALQKREAKALARKRGFQVGREISRFAAVGRQAPPDLSFEQRAMQEIMGGGQNGSIWGANDAVHINHDLNPSKRGDYGTREVFGMGNQPRAFQGGDAETRQMFGL